MSDILHARRCPAYRLPCGEGATTSVPPRPPCEGATRLFERLPTGRGGSWSWLRKRPGCSTTTTSGPSISCSALIHEGEGVAAKALESLGISLEAVRQQVEEIIGQGQQAPSGHIPFTPRAKKVLELSLREALQLGHNYIGTSTSCLA